MGWMFWGLGALALLYLLWRLVLLGRMPGLCRRHGQLVDFATLVPSWKPNQYLLAPPGTTTAQPQAEAPRYAVPPERLRDALVRIIEAEPRSRILERSGDGLRFTLVQTTALMAYPDFAAVEVRPAPGGSTLLIYSRAVFGIRDFGVNGKRVQGWLGKLADAAGKPV
ncbi:DUF1499 domain-containing protein [Oleisolibacter albus]|uniref:DUF1499 domain-containing protein n=1 Tax=Oleisolibacter albus TaxID=2171757 RepID=UPI000DF38830|nr:DUF1499 domain-containing protein [Oleisolibacter albus]